MTSPSKNIRPCDCACAALATASAESATAEVIRNFIDFSPRKNVETICCIVLDHTSFSGLLKRLVGPPEESMEGLRIIPGYLDRRAQEAAVAVLRQIIAAAPLYIPCVQNGKPMSVKMTNCGPLGWLTDRRGYRY